MAIFRIKFAYKAENQETGNIDKVKTEVLAQCINYTDAEAIAVKLIELENMNKLEPTDYEIIKQKFTHADFELNDDVVAYDTEDLINGLVEHYFADEDSHLYLVKMCVPFEDDNGNTKYDKYEAYVSAKSAVDALVYYGKVLKGNGCENTIAKQAKMDDATAIYLNPETHSQVFNRQIKA